VIKKHSLLNPSVMTVTMLGIGLPLSFSLSVKLNLLICLIAILYLAGCRVSLKTAIIVLLAAFPLALGSWWSFLVFGTGDRWHTAWIYGTRVYAYLLLGMTVTMTTSVKELLLSLEEHLHLSTTFVYGLLAAFNLLSRIKQAYRQIQYSALIRGQVYHLWQPGIYLRIILTALNWSGDLAEAMTSQGFSEGEQRTRMHHEPLPSWQWIIAGILILSYCWTAFFIRPW
jgi:energy-coupling factor transport system permease protein